jgi:WD40 repeat protein
LQHGRIVTITRALKDLGRGATFSPDGRLLVTPSGDDVAQVRDATTGQVVLTLVGHEKGKQERLGKIDQALMEQDPDYHVEPTYEHGVLSATFSPDGRHILTTSVDQTARIWDAHSGEPLKILRGHTDAVSFGSFSPDGSKIVTISSDFTARIWDATSGETTAILKLGGSGNEAYFSRDNHRIVTSAGLQVALWDAATGAEIVTLDNPEGVSAVSLSPDGRQLAIASRGGVTYWEIEAAAVVGEMHSRDDVSALSFTPDGHSVVMANRDGWRVRRAFRSTQELVQQIKLAAPRCLTRQEREQAYLPPTPPRWCITGPGLEHETDSAKWRPKWPYDGSAAQGGG